MWTAALDVGGTHVTAATVDVDTWTVSPQGIHRRRLAPGASAGELLGAIVECGRALGHRPGAGWGVAVPGPFDYSGGIGLFEGVGKFESLYGVDVRAALAAGLGVDAEELAFVNDADAFLLGEWVAGAAAGHDRAAAVTLGTGVGSAFLAGGSIVDDGPAVPPQGRVDLLTIDGMPLEHKVSRRALIADYARRVGVAGAGVEVRDLARQARNGEPAARSCLDAALSALGRALAPWLAAFGATMLVVGGGMAASWDVIGPPLRAGIRAARPELADLLAIRPARQADLAPLVGAAWHRRRVARSRVDLEGG